MPVNSKILNLVSKPDVDRFMVCTEVLRELTGILGLFFKAPPKSRDGGDSSLTDDLMQLIIKLRGDAREKKDFGHGGCDSRCDDGSRYRVGRS